MRSRILIPSHDLARNSFTKCRICVKVRQEICIFRWVILGHQAESLLTMNLLVYAILNSRLLTVFLLFNVSFVTFLLLTSELPQNIGSLLEEQFSQYQSFESVEAPVAPSFTEHPAVYDPSPNWLISALNDDDLPCESLPSPITAQKYGYLYPPSSSVRHRTLQSKYLPFQHQSSNPSTPGLDSDLDLAKSCVDSAIANGDLCASFAGQFPMIDVVWTFANGSGVLHEKWRKVRQVQQQLERAGTLAPRAALIASRQLVSGTEKKLFRCVGYLCRFTPVFPHSTNVIGTMTNFVTR
jgi:hypothetical protein